MGVLGTLAGCSGSSEDPPLDDSASINRGSMANPLAGQKSATESWDVVPNNTLALSAGSTFDLSTTLPSTVRAGGTFEVDRSGAPLPPGISLLPTGLLNVSSSATGGTAGVVFRYTPPA